LQADKIRLTQPDCDKNGESCHEDRSLNKFFSNAPQSQLPTFSTKSINLVGLFNHEIRIHIAIS
jgi:hypothetical protein